MDRRELLDRAAHSPEERLLLSRVWDKCEQCRTRNIPTATGFLSPAEQAAAQGFLVLLGARESGIFWGGYDGAERKRLLFSLAKFCRVLAAFRKPLHNRLALYSK